MKAFNSARYDRDNHYPPMKHSVFSAMRLGPRAIQEDCLLDGVEIFQANQLTDKKCIDTDFLALCVCDGMGGHDAGETASRFVCEQIKEKFDHTRFTAGALKSILYDIQVSSVRYLPENSGTTVAGLIVADGRTIVFNAGDSRVYKISDAGITYVSHDHSLVQGLVDKAYIEQETATFHPLKNIIEFGIGPLFIEEWKNLTIHMREEPLAEDACYLLCSDGVNDLLSDTEIYDLLMPSPVENGTALLNALTERGLKDNASFIILGTQDA